MEVLWIILGVILGAGIMTLILLPKAKKQIERNKAILTENELFEKLNKQLKYKNNQLQIEFSQGQAEYETLSARREEVKNSLEDLQQQADSAAQKFYDAAMEIAQASFDQEIEHMSEDLDKERKAVKQLYLDTTQDCVSTFQQAIDSKQKELTELKAILEKEKENVDVAVEAAKRRQEMANKQDFYRLVLSDADLIEIQRLREIVPYLRDKTALNKVIYKVYYERPLTDMIGRVVGTGTHTGIYKITNINTSQCYIGQAVDIANRWRQHVKRGVGAEDWTRNKLYPVMYALGVEHFTFEIIEECDRSQLNEREDYWQAFFHAKDFGYSIK